jgi:hypothetical protein
MHGKLLFGKIVAMPDSRWKLISIRTLRGEGDKLRSATLSSRSLFLATPSARRATDEQEATYFSGVLNGIQIAARELLSE